MSQLTENTIIIDKSDLEKLKNYVKDKRYADDSLKEIYQDINGNCLLTFDFNGSPTEYDDWPIHNYMIETDYGDGDDLWTRCDFIEIDDTIQSQIQKGLLFPELHNNNELFNSVMHSLEYNIGGLHGDDLYDLKPFSEIIDNLTSHQRELLLNAVNGFDNGDTAYYSSFDDLKERVVLSHILPIAYTTYGDNEEYEIQVDFDFNKMCYQEYINDKLINNPNKIDRNFYTFCHELENCGFEDMIRACVHQLPEANKISNDLNKQVTVGRDGLIDSNEIEINQNHNVSDEVYMQNIEDKHKQLADNQSIDENIRLLYFMEANNITIDEITDDNGNLKVDVIEDYFKQNGEPSNETILDMFTNAAEKTSNFKEWLNNLNKTKDGKDREFTNYKNRSMGK